MPPFVTLRVKIPPSYVPKVMGISGVTIKMIQEASKSKLAFEGPNNGIYVDGRVLCIKAAVAEGVQLARQMVEEICGPENVEIQEDVPIDQNFFIFRQFSPKKSFSDNPQNDTSLGELVEDEFLIPTDLVAHVVGRDEANLKSIQASLSLTSIEMMMSIKTEEGSFSPILICGTVEKVEEAKIMLQRMLNCFVHKSPEKVSKQTFAVSPSLTFLEEYHQQAGDEVVEVVQQAKLLVPKPSSPVQESVVSPVQKTLAAVREAPAAETSAPAPQTPAQNNVLIPVQKTAARVLKAPSPKTVVQKTDLAQARELPAQRSPFPAVPAPVQNIASTSAPPVSNPAQQTAVLKAAVPVQNNASTAKKSAVSTTSTQKRQLASTDQEDELKIKIQRRQLKVFEEQQEYFKKRSLLVEKQIQQIEMENYEKRTQLGFPASLSIEYNGQTIHLQNKYTAENRAQKE